MMLLTASCKEMYSLVKRTERSELSIASSVKLTERSELGEANALAGIQTDNCNNDLDYYTFTIAIASISI